MNAVAVSNASGQGIEREQVPGQNDELQVLKSDSLQLNLENLTQE